ncbi:MAG TPA: hypothetical protein VF517_15360, partial [Thermoleophilaceae bacterium]
SATGTLTINVSGGGTLTGLVDSTTRIECEDRSGVTSASSGPGRDGDGSDDNSGPSSNSGPGSTTSDRGDDDRGDDDARDDDRNDDDRDDDDRVCTTADLTPGTVVHEAEVELRDGKAVFEEVELLKP